MCSAAGVHLFCFYLTCGLFMKLRNKIAGLALLFASVGIALFYWLSTLPPTSLALEPNVALTAGNGEALFWGKGGCHVCHRIGERGYALRGPNLGQSKDGPVLPARAQVRSKQLGLESAVDYVVQSIATPNIFIVPGYRGEMPRVYEPPSSLFPSEIKAIIAYLFSLDGDTVVPVIHLPAGIFSPRRESQGRIELARNGDVSRGRTLFRDASGPAACASCHAADDASIPESGATGPSLASIALIRSQDYIYHKIVNPDSNLVSGYGQILLKLQNGTLVSGLLAAEDDSSLTVREKSGRDVTFNKVEVQSVVEQQGSPMPGNYAVLLTKQDLSDLLAFLLTLRGAL